MKIELIPLAEKKIRRRVIPYKWIKETIQNPDKICVGYQNRKVMQKIYHCHGKKKLLRVIGEVEKDKFVVITAYLTSRIKKYSGGGEV